MTTLSPQFLMLPYSIKIILLLYSTKPDQKPDLFCPPSSPLGQASNLCKFDYKNINSFTGLRFTFRLLMQINLG